MIICAIYDKKAKVYDTPFILPNAAIANRAFASQMQTEQLKKFCGDFELHQLGEFTNNEVEFTAEQQMKVIIEWDLSKKFVKLADGKNYEVISLQEKAKK